MSLVKTGLVKAGLPAVTCDLSDAIPISHYHQAPGAREA
jgi:hypothetical protein